MIIHNNKHEHVRTNKSISFLNIFMCYNYYLGKLFSDWHENMNKTINCVNSRDLENSNETKT